MMTDSNLLLECQRWSRNRYVLFGIFSLAVMASFYRGYGFSNNSYAIASWLVTYEGGFIKRGLIGSILQLEYFSRLSGISVPTLFFCITNTMLVLLHIMVLLISFRMVSLNKTVLLFMPYFLSGPLLRTQSVWIGNVDHLLALMIIGLTYCLIKEKVIMAAIIAVVGIFIHEIMFAMVLPILAYSLLSSILKDRKIIWNNLRAIFVSILASVSAVLFVVFYHDLFFSGEKAASYIGQMISRQTEDNYNSGAIVEAYTTSFSDWFLSQKEYFIERIMDPGLLIVVTVPALIFFARAFLLSRRSRLDFFILSSSFLFVLSPLGILVIAWDIDRIWNLSIWTLFMIMWMWTEREDGHDFSSGLVTAALFFISIPAFLTLQVRSNIEWDATFIIYSPFIVWQLVFIAGCFYKKRSFAP